MSYPSRKNTLKVKSYGATVHAAQRLGKARTSVNFAMEKCWHRRWVSSLPRDSLLLALRSIPFSFDVFCNGKFDHCGCECVFRGLLPHHWQRNMSMRAHVHLYPVGQHSGLVLVLDRKGERQLNIPGCRDIHCSCRDIPTYTTPSRSGVAYKADNVHCALVPNLFPGGIITYHPGGFRGGGLGVQGNYSGRWFKAYNTSRT